ncbi:Hypothetical predicted protein [Lecanosticta acicola]|uniref:Uncharacterized protein n=1 Tax=Lecanosticta acicola TaxID=111012 RepID=A0AAI9E9I9_9PEZI|nr:Hypothetical predicted protein [Lecanosticta acicola]
MSHQHPPKVVLLLLELGSRSSFLDEQFDILKAKADVQVITQAAEASTLFNSTSRPVVFAADEALTQQKYAQQKAEAVTYIRNGGTIVFGGRIGGRTRSSDINELFADLSLPWLSGSYYRTDFDLNPSMTQINTSRLAHRFSQKAMQLSDVQQNDKIYVPAPSARLQSLVFPAVEIEDHSETPAAFGSCGLGKVGYLGDVNAEPETAEVLLAMCGLSGWE